MNKISCRIVLLVWGIPSTYFRSKFRKIVYKTDDWKITLKQETTRIYLLYIYF